MECLMEKFPCWWAVGVFVQSIHQRHLQFHDGRQKCDGYDVMWYPVRGRAELGFGMIESWDFCLGDFEIFLVNGQI